MRDGFRLAITGATGDFGRVVLRWACANDNIAEVTALGRRPTGVRHDKVRENFLDLGGRVDLESVRGYDALIHLAYCVEEPRRQAARLSGQRCGDADAAAAGAASGHRASSS